MQEKKEKGICMLVCLWLTIPAKKKTEHSDCIKLKSLSLAILEYKILFVCKPQRNVLKTSKLHFGRKSCTCFYLYFKIKQEELESCSI